jgi:hypothetical protein
MNEPPVEKDWQLAAYLAIFQKLLVDQLAQSAALRPDGANELQAYRIEMLAFLQRNRWAQSPTTDELAEWDLHCNQAVTKMFDRAEALRARQPHGA